jgi:soluble lytic murein transglycosylase-like protein
MPASGDRYATATERLRPAEQRLRDPRTSILTGARLLADLQRRFGRIDASLAAWNASEGRVRRAGGTLPRFAETEAEGPSRSLPRAFEFPMLSYASCHVR